MREAQAGVLSAGASKTELFRRSLDFQIFEPQDTADRDAAYAGAKNLL